MRLHHVRGDTLSNFTNASQFAKHIRETGTAVQRSQRDAMNRVGLVSKEIMARQPGVPHIVAGKKVSVRYDVSTFGDRSTVSVTWRGPVHLVNNPTQPHPIVPKAKRGTGAALGGGLIEIAGGPRASAESRGTAGKGFHQRGEAEAARIVPTVLRGSYHRALASHFGV